METLETAARPSVIETLSPHTHLRKISSFPALLVALLSAVAFVIAKTFRIDPDTWWHLAVGRGILSTHSWPSIDTYSFTVHGSPWIAYEWLADVVMAAAERAAGLTGLMVLLLILTAAITLLIYAYAYQRCRNSKAAFVSSVVVLPLAGIWFTLHPQLFGLVLLIITFICLEGFRAGRVRSLWLLPGVFAVWVNTHGTFVFGAVAYVIYWLSGLIDFRRGRLVAEPWTSKQRLQLAVVALSSTLACCITPYGTRLAAYPAQMVLLQQEVTTSMSSWQPIAFNIWHGKLFLALVLVFIVWQATSEVSLRLEELGLLLFAIVMTAMHSRALPLFAIVFAPIFARMIERWVPAYNAAKDQYALNAVLMLALILGAAKAFPSRKSVQDSIIDTCPERAIEYLGQHPPAGHMLNELTWGGYLLWRFGPETRVFIDGRLDIYAYAGVLSDYLHMTEAAPDTFFLLRKYDVRSCFIRPKSALATLLAASPLWRKAYEDSLSVLFVRDEP